MGFKPNFLYQKSWNFIQKNEKKSKNIIVSFAGGALVMGGMTQFELVKTLEDTDCDQLFLLGTNSYNKKDPTGMSYYLYKNGEWNGYEELYKELKSFVSNYERVLFIGMIIIFKIKETVWEELPPFCFLHVRLQYYVLTR
jgi:hypothetical protein